MRTFRQLLSGYVISLVVLLLGATPLLAKCGHLNLHVTPDQAYVFVDNVPLGSGGGVFWADPGEHTLAVYNYGYKPYTTKFTAESGKTTSLSVALEVISGTVPGPWGTIQLKGSAGAAVLLNGTTPDFFVGNVGEFTGGKRRLLVPPGNYQLTVLACCGGTIFSGPISVGENQRTIVDLAKAGEKSTADWPEGKSLGSLARFQAEGGSITVAVAKPTAQLSAASAQFACNGSDQLTWSTTDAPSVELSEVGAVAPSGTQAIQPKQTTNYKLTATGPGGVATSDATVSVASNIQSSLNVTPAEIRYHKVGDKVDEQGSTTISWSAPDGTTVSIDPFGSVSTTGSRTDQPTPNLTGYGPIDQTVTYTLHVTNACGVSDTKTASLHIVGSWEGVQHVDLGNSVYFPTAVPTRANPEGGLVASQAQVLEQLVTNLKQLLQVSPNAQLTLEGHADIRGGTQFNIALSERRAERVRTFLVQQGIGAANLKTSGLGKGQDPDRAKVLQLAAEAGVSAPEQKKIGRNHRIYVLANNRRVDIVLSTGERSHEYYPYTAADLRELLNGHHRGRAAHASKKAKETK